MPPLNESATTTGTPERSATPIPTAILNTTPSVTAISTPKSTQSITPTAPQPNQGVSLTADKGGYQTGETIVATIRNDLSVPIFGLTGKTYCTILMVQRKEGDHWQDLANCIAGAPPAWEPIAAGTQVVVRLAPQLPSDQPMPPGDYRILFDYRVGSSSGTQSSSYSAPFMIVQANP